MVPRLILRSVLGLIVASPALVAQPTSNPVRDRYGIGAYEWTSRLTWEVVVDVRDFGAIPDDDLSDQAAIEAAIAAAAQEPFGATVWLPAGTYDLTDNLVLQDGVILRGDTPPIPTATNAAQVGDESWPLARRGDGSTLDAPAQHLDFAPPSRLRFPAYEPVLSEEGSLVDSAFRVITVADPERTSRWGLVHLSIDHARIRNFTDALPGFSGEQAEEAGLAHSLVFFGLQINHAATPDPTVPQGGQLAWQRFQDRRAAYLSIWASSTVLIANCRMGAETTRAFAQPGYLLASGEPAPVAVPFRYTDAHGIVVNAPINLAAAPIGKVTPATFPEAFRPAIVIRDCLVYTSSMPGIVASGAGLTLEDNVVLKQADPVAGIDPTGTDVPLIGPYGGYGAVVSGSGVRVTGNAIEAFVTQLSNGSDTFESDDGVALWMDPNGWTAVLELEIRNNRFLGPVLLQDLASIHGLEVIDNRFLSVPSTTGFGRLALAIETMAAPAHSRLQEIEIDRNAFDLDRDVTLLSEGGVFQTRIHENLGGDTLSYTLGTREFLNGFLIFDPRFPSQLGPPGLGPVTVTSPAAGQFLDPEFTLEASLGRGTAERFEFWIEGELVASQTEGEVPPQVTLPDLPRQLIMARAVASDGSDRWSPLGSYLEQVTFPGVTFPQVDAFPAGDRIELRWQGQIGDVWRIERSPALIRGSWELMEIFTMTAEFATWSTPVTGERHFFRLVPDF